MQQKVMQAAMLSNKGVVFALFVILLGCGQSVHEHGATPQAVGDSERVLGLVPVSKDKPQVYRLVVCQHLPQHTHYTKAVLANPDICRAALYDQQGNEVVFLPGDLQRGLVTKYRGYAKQAVVLAVVPLALVVSGSWRLLKYAGRKLRLQDFDNGKYSGALIQQGIGQAGVRRYLRAWSDVATKTFDDIKNSTDADVIRAKLAELERLTSSYRNATAISAMTAAQKTLEHLRYTPHKQAKQTIARIEQKLIKENNGTTSFSAEGSFGNNFFLLHKQLQSLFKSADEGADLESLQTLAERIKPLAEDYVIKLPAYEKLYADSSVLAIERSAAVDFYRHFQRYQDELANKKKLLLADSRMRTVVEIAHVRERSLIKSAVAGGASGVGTLGILHVLDKSIWGYEDRQLNRYWQQVFVAADDLSNPQLIDDLPQLLQALSDAFGYQVNAAALEL